MAKQRTARGSHEPGTFWYYNNWDFNTLGTIYEHATGTGIYDALDRLIIFRAPPRSIALPAAHERARSRAVCLAVFEQGRLGRTADRAGRLGPRKARIPTRSNLAPGSGTAICGGPLRRRRGRVGFRRAPSSPGAPAASTP